MEVVGKDFGGVGYGGVKWDEKKGDCNCKLDNFLLISNF